MENLITISTTWRLAKLSDFFNGIPISEPGHKRMIGRPFLVRNRDGNLEMYKLSETSDAVRISLWVKNQMIYVLDAENFTNAMSGSEYIKQSI